MKSTALNTAEAELMAASEACREAVSLRGLCEEHGHPQQKPTVLKMDNTAAIAIAEDPQMHDKSKHIHRRHLYIRELVAEGIIEPKYVKTGENTSDIFTKPLPRKEFEYLKVLSALCAGLAPKVHLGILRVNLD